MKKVLFVLTSILLLVPATVLAVSSNGNSVTNGNASTTVSSTSSVNGNGSTSQSSRASNQTATQSQTNNSGSATQLQNENQVRTQTSNPGIGSMTREEAQTRVEEQVKENKSEYTPKSEKAQARMSAVATAVESLVRTASGLENQGIGDQIRVIAKTQVQNQDKINQSIDKTEKRTSFAKFFIGANYKELKNTNQLMVENKNQIKELQKLMSDLTTDTEKLAIANQIVVLQEEQLQLREQVLDLTDEVSLFGWINRWWNKY